MPYACARQGRKGRGQGWPGQGAGRNVPLTQQRERQATVPLCVLQRLWAEGLYDWVFADPADSAREAESGGRGGLHDARQIPRGHAGPLLAEVEAYWAKHEIPPAQQVLNPDASMWCKKYFYKHDGTTHTTVETDQQTTMEKTMDMKSAEALGSQQGILNLDLQEPSHAPASDVPVMTAAQVLKLSKTRSASFKRLHEAL
eukprot:6462110-Amphidinium_carterae.1